MQYFFNGKAIPLTWWREPASYRPSIHFLNHLVQGCRRLEPHLPQDERRGTDRTACQFITEIQRTIHSHIHTSTLLTEFALHVKISLLIMRIIIQACGGKHISYSCGGAFKHLRQSLWQTKSGEFGRLGYLPVRAYLKMQPTMHLGKCSSSCFRFGHSFFDLSCSQLDFNDLGYCT